MFPTIRCFAGRITVRHDRVAGLIWDRPCPVPTEVIVPTEPPMYFCYAHGQVMLDQLFQAFDTAGLIDQGIVAGPPDEFDELMLRLGPLESQ
jgi:hypothetical protein